MPDRISHAELDSLLDRLRLGVGASDLHGSLTGYLCAGGVADAGAWPHALELEGGDGGWGDDGLFAFTWVDGPALLGALYQVGDGDLLDGYARLGPARVVSDATDALRSPARDGTDRRSPPRAPRSAPGPAPTPADP